MGRRTRTSWVKGQSGNPNGRQPYTPAERAWLQRLLVAAKRKATIDENGKPVLEKYKQGTKVDMLTVAADVVMKLAGEGNPWAVEHVANRFDGKVKEQLDITTTTNVKIRYESYEEARAALLEEGIDVNRLPMLTDMRKPAERESN